MKNIPLYDVRHIEDLRDMLKQSTELYGDLPLFYYKKVKGGDYEYYTFNEYNHGNRSFPPLRSRIAYCYTG